MEVAPKVLKPLAVSSAFNGPSAKAASAALHCFNYTHYTAYTHFSRAFTPIYVIPHQHHPAGLQQAHSPLRERTSSIFLATASYSLSMLYVCLNLKYFSFFRM